MTRFPLVVVLASAAFTFGCGDEAADPDHEAQVIEKLNEEFGSPEYALFHQAPHEISECLLGAWAFTGARDGYMGTGYLTASIGNRCDEPVVIYTKSRNGGGGSLQAQTSAGTVTWCSWDGGEWSGAWEIVYLQPGEILGVGSALKPALILEGIASVGQVRITWPMPNGPRPSGTCRTVDPESWIEKNYNIVLSDEADSFLSAELLQRR